MTKYVKFKIIWMRYNALYKDYLLQSRSKKIPFDTDKPNFSKCSY